MNSETAPTIALPLSQFLLIVYTIESPEITTVPHSPK